MKKLNLINIQEYLEDYLNKVNEMKCSPPHEDVLVFINSLKRKAVGSGPYPDVSLFEASNRILSDVLILFGVRRLLTNPSVNNITIPFKEYDVSLGVEGGNDLKAFSGSIRLIGEAFNVAPSFFQQKKSSALKKLIPEKADYRLIIFNSDAVRNPDDYIKKSERSMIYLPIDIWNERRWVVSLTVRRNHEA